MKNNFFSGQSAAKFWHQVFILFIALLAGHTIVINRTDYLWITLLHKSFYYYSVFGSGFIAYVLIQYVCFITKWLNELEKGFRMNNRRIKKQLAYGFAGAVLLAIALAFGLYKINGESITSGVYFSRLLILVILFIVVINFSYCFYHARKAMEQSAIAGTDSSEPVTKIRYKWLIPKQKPRPGKLIKLEENHVPALIYIENKVPQAIDARGEWIKWDLNITQSVQNLPVNDYFRIHKRFLIHRSFVKEIAPHGDQILISPATECKFKLITSRRKTARFKEWIEGADPEPLADPDQK